MQDDVVVEGTCASVQGLPVNAPEPLLENVTVPCGNDLVPESVSDTTTVHVVDPFTGTDDGEQPVTTVDVDRACTVNPKGVALLSLAV